MFEEQESPKPHQPHITQREMTVYQYESKPPNALAYGVAGILFGLLFGILIPGFIFWNDSSVLQDYTSSLFPSGASVADQASTAVWTIYLAFFAYVSVFAAIIYFIAAGRSALAAIGLIIFLAGPGFVVLMLS